MSIFKLGQSVEVCIDTKNNVWRPTIIRAVSGADPDNPQAYFFNPVAGEKWYIIDPARRQFFAYLVDGERSRIKGVFDDLTVSTEPWEPYDFRKGRLVGPYSARSVSEFMATPRL